MPPHFVGREELAANLTERLISGKNLALSAEGLPGVGKTTLAVALVHHREVLRHFKDGVLWAGLGSQADVMSALTAWAEALKVDVSELMDETARQQAIKNAIGQRYFLLVIDDVWDVQAARLLRCGGPNCCHLLTTRDKGIARAFAGAGHSRNVPPLEDNPAFDLLRKLAPEACEADPKAAQLLAETIGGLPLALELLGGYLSVPERTLFPDLSQAALTEMTDPQRRLQLAAERLGAPGVETTLHQTIGLSLEGLRESERGREAERVFYALGAFAPKPESFSREAAEAVAETDAGVLALLAARNLVELAGKQLALHQTLADVARTNVDEIAVARHHNYYLTLVNEDWEDWQRIEAVYGQIKWAWQNAPEDESLLDFIGALQVYQERRGLRQDELEWYKRGLKVVRAHNLRKDEGTILTYIGAVYSSLRQWQQALDYYNQALAIHREVSDRVGLATTLNNIGWVYNGLDQWQKGLDYFSQAHSIYQEEGNRAGLTATLNNIGRVYNAMSHWQQALNYYNQALAIHREASNQAGLAFTLNNIGAIYFQLERWDTALDYLNQALSIRREIGDLRGESTTRELIAMTHRDKGDLAEAAKEMSQAAELAELSQNPYLGQMQEALAQIEAKLAEQKQD